MTGASRDDIIHVMNNFYSPHEFIYRPRWITAPFRTALAAHPIVVLTGARQVGKSTLLQHAEPVCHWRYRTLDDFDVLRQATQNPDALWAGTDRIVLDEVQRAPALFSAVKQAVDQAHGAFRVVLSGSANLLLMRRVSESLAGRAVYLVLAPMTLGEMWGTPPPRILDHLRAGVWPADGRVSHALPDLFTLALRGFLPALLSLEQPEDWTRWWEGYVATYLERDLRELSQIPSLVDFHRCMELLALRNGQILNQSEVARDAGIPQPTVHRYLTLLETTYLVERLPAYTPSRTTRLIKAPKLYWADTGLVAFLAGYYDRESLAQAREAGAYFETVILHHLKVLSQLLVPRGRLYYWRTRRGEEVDFILEQGRQVWAFECKMTTTARYGDAEGLRHFLQAVPQARGGILLYHGSEISRLDDRIIALPWILLATGGKVDTQQ
ncbi:MAG: ATP-binding protein [Nitrospinota bacterium]|nr:MAG: ATP-binding protein [Nitrospinota bacterium]